jgi:glutamine amidotransferase
VPGVGHFARTRALDGTWSSAIRVQVDRGRPLLGICLGLQWLFEGSDESPDVPGLGMLPGRCHRLSGGQPNNSKAQFNPDLTSTIKIPHVGWNSVDILRDAPIARGIPSGTQVYFSHSYAAPLTSDAVGATEHGETFAAVVQREQVAGVQFHPEKSGEAGLRFLRNFLDLTE